VKFGFLILEVAFFLVVLALVFFLAINPFKLKKNSSDEFLEVFFENCHSKFILKSQQKYKLQTFILYDIVFKKS
jgi:hypothetical protein